MAPVSEVTYTQSWTIAVSPGPGDEPWPPLGPFGRNKHVIQPDMIFVYVEPGREPVITGTGIRRKRDGSPGALRMDAPWLMPEDVPGWAKRIARGALRQHHLDGRVYHVASPLAGSVRDRDGSPCPDPGRRDSCWPLTGVCAECRGNIQQLRLDGDWLHTAALPDWMRAP